MKKEKLQSKLMAKAWKDPEFKKRLLANPKETISAFIKEHFPNVKKLENANFKVVEHDPKTIVIGVCCITSKEAIVFPWLRFLQAA